MSGRETAPRRVLVLSDSHGFSPDGILMRAEADGKIDAVIHLGDGYHDLDPYRSELPEIVQVAGNCDFCFSAQADAALVTELYGVRLLLTHGHTLHVRAGTDALVSRALDEGARAALFGHTHTPLMREENGVLLLNPGAAMQGKYAMLFIYPNGALDAQLF